MNRGKLLSLAGACCLATLHASWGQSYTVTLGGVETTLSKVADLPLTIDPGSTGTGMGGSRSDLVQVGNELWFTTREGGNNLVGSISAYNIVTGQLSLKYSFGLGDPDDPFTVKLDGYMPFSGVVAGQGAYAGKYFYSTRYGGASYVNDGNGGAVGVFDPATGKTTVLWSGTSNPSPNQVYAKPVYVDGGANQYLYFLTNGGGIGGPSGNFGTIQKLNLTTQVTTQVTSFYGTAYYTGSNVPSGTTAGRQPQGGLVQAGSKLYFGTGTGGAQKTPTDTTGYGTLQVLDTVNDTVTVLANNIDSGIYNTPIFDADRERIYAVTLNKGIYQWNINTGVGEILANSIGTGSVFANPILFSDSIFYVTQGGSNQNTNGGFIYRYDLELAQLFQLYDLTGLNFGTTGTQAGSFSVVMEEGMEVLYFTTSAGGANGAGTILRLEVTPVPEPSTMMMAALGVAGLLWRRRRRCEG